MSLERCANCDAPIGKMETPHVWGDAVVCAACHRRLSAEHTLTDDDVITQVPVPQPAAPRPPLKLQYGTFRHLDAPPVATGPPPPRFAPPGGIICPNPHCGYIGMPVRKPKGSRAVLYILLLLWILPGLIYLMLYQGYTLHCPRCGMKVGDA